METRTDLKKTGSTNDDAKNLARKGASGFTLVTARKQTAGRGRMNRSFFSSDSAGVYMSMILKDFGSYDVTQVTAMIAVAVSDAIESVSESECHVRLETGIKWVNDIYIDGRKVSGILAEGEFEADGSMKYLVAGIGVNIATKHFPENIKGKATSIAIELDKMRHRADNLIFVRRAFYRRLRDRLIDEIAQNIRNMFSTNTDKNKYLKRYVEKSCLIGKKVEVYNICERDGEKPLYTAVAEDIDDKCRLCVTDMDGRSHVLDSGEVRIKQGRS